MAGHVEEPGSADDGVGDTIALLEPELADQIAAGEVVERPASVVKELVENALDAGASRIDVELQAGGAEGITVIDDGRGIDPDQLGLALRRHATSKLRRAQELLEIGTLGFRGEALASIAAVARVRIRSRRGGVPGGRELESIPGESRRERPVAMAPGTQVHVGHLFATIPARRKFLRSESTEVGHCVDTILREALVHPAVAFSLRHGERELLRLRAGTPEQRVAQVLDRRGQGPYFKVEGVHEGVHVVAHLADPRRSVRRGASPAFVVRRRVVRDRNLSSIVRDAYGPALAKGSAPLACVFIEPPRGGVDVNVHPQKTEVRFAEPQRVYAAVRRVLADGLAEAPWRSAEPDEVPSSAVDAKLEGARAAMARWEGARPDAQAEASREHSGRGASGSAPSSGRAYSLGTRAASAGYAAHKAERRAVVERVSAAAAGRAVSEAADAASSAQPQPQLLAAFPGHVAVFRFEDRLWAVDLIVLRGALLQRRLVDELGGGGVVAQGLLAPVTMTVPRADAELVERNAGALRRVGLALERFGDDAIVVRAVPALMPHCVDDDAVRGLVERVLPWLRLRERSGEGGEHGQGVEAGLRVLAAAPGRDPSARLARRWLADARERFGDAIPGVRRWDPRALVDPESAG